MLLILSVRCFWLKTAHKKHRVKLRVPFIYDEWKKLLKTLFNGEPAYIIVTDGLIIGLDCLHTEKENDEQHAYEVVLAGMVLHCPYAKVTRFAIYMPILVRYVPICW